MGKVATLRPRLVELKEDDTNKRFEMHPNVVPSPHGARRYLVNIICGNSSNSYIVIDKNHRKFRSHDRCYGKRRKATLASKAFFGTKLEFIHIPCGGCGRRVSQYRRASSRCIASQRA